MELHGASTAGEDGGSSSSTPYHSAPSSPSRLLPAHYFSAPTSPMHYLCSAPSAAGSACSSPPHAPFEFSFSPRPPDPSASADELFLDGRIRPTFPAPLPDDTRDPRLRSRSVHRRARSMSPPRNPPSGDWCEPDPKPDEAEDDATTSRSSSTSSSSSSSSSGKGSRRWVFLKDLLLLHRGRSDGRADPAPRRQAGKGDLPPAGKAKRRTTRGAAEKHYAEKKAEAEEMRRKTFLPYRAGLLGCLGFSSRGYGAFSGIARTWGATVGSR